MSDKKLTQEEIDRMINAVQNNEDSKELTDTQLNLVKKFIDKSLTASVEALQLALSKKLTLNNSTNIQKFSSNDISNLMPDCYMVVKIDYKGDVNGYDLLLIKKANAIELAKLQLSAMGIDIDASPEIENSAVLELMNQMMGKSACVLSEEYGLDVDISTPSIQEVSSSEEAKNFFSTYEDDYISASYNYSIDGCELTIDILKILDYEFAKNLNTLLDKKESNIVNNSMVSKMEDEEDVYDYITIDEKTNLDYNISPEHHNNDKLYGGEHKVDENIPEVYPYRLTQIEDYNNNASFDLPISKLNEVTIELSVELGRTKKTIKEILDMGKGSIVELNKLSGEPVDLYANGTLIGHGEVVIIKDYFSIKILDIIDSKKEN